MPSFERDGDTEAFRGRHHRPPTPARRELLARFRDEVRQGTYRPSVDALAAHLAVLIVDRPITRPV